MASSLFLFQGKKIQKISNGQQIGAAARGKITPNQSAIQFHHSF